MRPAIVTVVTTAAWESRLVETARSRGMVRLLGRCSTMRDVEMRLDSIDAVVVGVDTPWLTPTLCKTWRQSGVSVVGVVSSLHDPASRLLTGSDLVVNGDTPADRILAQIAALPRHCASVARARMVTVVGPRGSPGCTEVALALAATGMCDVSSTILVELDGEAPSLGVRLGVSPTRTPVIVDPMLGRGFQTSSTPTGLHLLTVPVLGGPLTESITARIIESARFRFDAVIVDAGPRNPGELSFGPGSVVLVVEPSPGGIIRAARMVEQWSGPPPFLVLNRSDGRTDDLNLVRRATGLEPDAVIPDLGFTPLGEASPLESHLASMAHRIIGGSHSAMLTDR